MSRTEKKLEAPKEHQEEFIIVVDKIYGPDLGIDALFGDSRGILVQAVKSGLISDWNASNPHREVRQGDRIMEVNGIRGHSQKMVEEIKDGQILHMSIFSKEKELKSSEQVKSSEEVTASMSCLSCGNAYVSDDLFCRHCGQKRKQARSSALNSLQPRAKRGRLQAGEPSSPSESGQEQKLQFHLAAGQPDALDNFASKMPVDVTRKTRSDLPSTSSPAPETADRVESNAKGKHFEKAKELKRLMQQQNKPVYHAYSHVFDQMIKSEQPKLSPYATPSVLQKSASQLASAAALARRAGLQRQAIGRSSLARAGGTES